MAAFWSIAFSWLPAWVQVVILGLVAVIVILIILKIVGLVLNAIPFL